MPEETRDVLVVARVPEDGDKPYFPAIRARLWTKSGESEKLLASTPLDAEGQGRLRGIPPEAELKVDFVDSTGRVLQAKRPAQADDDQRIQTDLELKGQMAVAIDPGAMPITRSGRLTTPVPGWPLFERCSLSVALVTDDEQRALRAKFAGAEATDEGWIFAGDIPASSLAGIDLARADLGFDGAFRFRSPSRVASGWLFVLLGSASILGFRKDDLTRPEAAGLDVFVDHPAAEVRGPMPGRVVGLAASQAPSDRGSLTAPVKATESEILDHPERFFEDPGSACRPFRNPERILGEKRFQTVLRVEQPEILGDTLASAELSLLDLESLDLQVSRASTWGRKTPSGSSLIDWEGDALPNQAVTVAGGHILEWRVAWRSYGYSLGTVSHTLTLAPRQIKRIVKIDFERRETTARRETTSVDDEVAQTTTYDRDYTNAVQANLNEWAHGSSQSHMAGAAGGAGGVTPQGVVLGGGAAYGGAWSEASQQGGRQATATELQSLRDAIRQHGESMRQRNSTVVTEVTQSETVEGVSEIIANPNFCHSLTVVYYEILRHLRVDTELAGVSECLFVPFKITPFTAYVQGIDGPINHYDVRRLIRYRDTIERSLLDKKLAWVLPYLEGYAEGFDDTVPDGLRMDQQLFALRGTVDIEISVASPLEGDEDHRAYEEIANPQANDREILARTGQVIGAAIIPFRPLLGGAIAAASTALAGVAAEQREELFQREIAGNMARRFVENLRLKVGDRTLVADFTLEGGYRKGRRHRVHFQVSRRELEESGVTRADLETMTVRPYPSERFSLPNYSTANVTGSRVQFTTAQYGKTVSDEHVFDDLFEMAPPGDAKANRSSALLRFQTTAWEREHLRNSIRRDVKKLVKHLDSHLFHYHKAIWWNMDADELYTILDGYQLSGSDGRSIASVVEYRPLSIVGNTLVFRVARGAFVGVYGLQSPDAARAFYEPKTRNADSMHISMPTGGVYARSLMDECGACEEHYGSTDWVLERDELLPQELDSGLLASRRAAPMDTAPTDMPETLINLQNAPAAPSPSGLQGGFDAMTAGDSFRDMAGLEGTQRNARAAMEAARSLASQFGNLGAKQMDAERAARARINRDPDLTPRDREEIVKHNAPEVDTDLVNRAERLVNKGVRDFEVKEKESTGANPRKEHSVSVGAYANRGIAFASAGSTGGGSQGGGARKELLDLAKEFGQKMFDIVKDGADEPDADLKELLKDGIEEFVEEKTAAAGETAVKKLPMGPALLVGCKLSLAFAKGAGERLVVEHAAVSELHNRLIDEVGRSLDANDGLTVEDISRLRRLSRWQLEAVNRLGPIMVAGLEGMAKEAAGEIGQAFAQKITNESTSLGKKLAEHKQSLGMIAKLVTDDDDAADNPVEAMSKAAAERMASGLIGALLKGSGEADFRNAISQSISQVRNNAPDAIAELLAGVADAYLKIDQLEIPDDMPGNAARAAIQGMKDQLIRTGRELLEEVGPGSISNGAVAVGAGGVTLPESVKRAFSSPEDGYDMIATMEMFSLFDAFRGLAHETSDSIRLAALATVSAARRSEPTLFAALEDGFLAYRSRRVRNLLEAFGELRSKIMLLGSNQVQFARFADDRAFDDFIDKYTSHRYAFFRKTDVSAGLRGISSRQAVRFGNASLLLRPDLEETADPSWFQSA